jgi:cytochrome c
MRGILRVQAMQRILSYVAALLIIAGLGWMAWRLGAGSSPQAAASGPYRFAAVPVGADGPLKACVVCHSVEKDGPLRVAPPLHGIVGAKKARAEWYGYSPALRRAGGTWSEADLDKFLTAPSTFLPGTTKTIIGVRDPKERADIIAALKQRP